MADLEAARDVALERFGRVDLVMNNVGVLAVGPVEAIPIEAWERTVDINLFGVVRSNLVFLPLLLDQGSGHIVNTASTAGLLPYGFDRLPYTATKHAIVGLSESLALYMRPRGIGVSCLCPAGVATNILEQITFYGEPAPPRGPAFPVLDADTVGEIVADGVRDDRVLILTHHDPDPDAIASGLALRTLLRRTKQTAIIGTMQLFAEPYLITRTGPGNSTETLGTYLYRQGFTSLNFGYASAIAYTMAGLAVVMTLLQLRLTRDSE